MVKKRLGKWEKATGVPNERLVDVYMRKYRYLANALSLDKIKGDTKEMERFRLLLGKDHAGAPLYDLGQQLLDLRKKGLVNLGTGNPGPSNGYKDKALESVENALFLEGIPADATERILSRVRELLKTR